MGATRRPEYFVALFVAVGWAALVFAVDGVIAVASGRDPIPTGIGPYYGVVSLLVAAVVVWLAVARAPAAPGPWLATAVAAAGVYLVCVLGAASIGFRLAVLQARSPFVIAEVVIAAATVVVSRAAVAAWRRAAS